MSLHATWYDGESSRARAVQLACVEGALLLAFEDGSHGRWPLQTITISPRLGSTPRILRLPDGARVEAADSPEVERWFKRTGSRIEGFADWLERRRAAMLASAALVLVATVAFLHFGVPWLAREAAQRMPAAVERHASEQVVAMLERVHFHPSRIPAARVARIRCSMPS